MRRFLPLILIVVFISVNGCAYFNVPIVTPAQPLQEKVLEGEGTAKILLVNISGTISEQEKSKKMGLEEEASMVSIIKEELLKAEKDKDIKGVIFNRAPISNYSLAEMTNPKVIHDLSGVQILGSLPEIDDLHCEGCKFGKLKDVFKERIQVDKIIGGLAEVTPRP